MDFKEQGLENTVLPGSLFNEYTFGTVFIKIVDKDDNETYNVPLKDGLNERPFNQSINYVSGGFKFTDTVSAAHLVEHVRTIVDPRFVRTVQIPDDAQVYIDKEEFSSDKIILGEKQPISECQFWNDLDFISEIKDQLKQKIYASRKLMAFIAHHISPEEMKEMVKMDGYLIEYIPNPSEELQMVAINTSPYCYKFIKNPTEKVSMEALKRDESVFYSMTNRTEEICIMAIKKKPFLISYMSAKEQTDEVCRICLALDGMMLIHLKVPKTPELCLIAVTQNSGAIAHVPPESRTYEVYLAAVSGNGSNLQQVPEKFHDDAMIKAAIKNKGSAIQYAKMKNDDILRLAFEADPLTNKSVDEPTSEMIERAIANKPEYLTKITDPTYNMCLIAVGKNGLMLEHVPEKHQTEDLIKVAVQNNGNAIRFANIKTPEIYELAVTSKPEAIQHLDENEQTEQLALKAINANIEFIKFVKKPTDDMYILWVKKDPYNIKNIPNLSKRVAIEALKKNGFAYQYLPIEMKKDEDLQLTAISEWPYSFRQMKSYNPTKEVCLAAVFKKSELIEDVAEQTEEMAIYAVLDIPYNLRYIKEHTQNFCEAVMEKHPHLFPDLKIKTAKMCKQAVQHSPHFLKYVPEGLQTSEICLIAINKDPMVIEHVKKPTNTMNRFAVTKNPATIRFIKDKTPDLCIIAIKKDPTVLKFIDDQKPELVQLALSLNPLAFEHVKDPTIENVLMCVQKRASCLADLKKQEPEICAACALINPDALPYIKNLDDRAQIKKWIDVLGSEDF